MKILAIALAISLASCGYTPSDTAKRAAFDAAVYYINHELNAK
jgi:hypothetical protein